MDSSPYIICNVELRQMKKRASIRSVYDIDAENEILLYARECTDERIPVVISPSVYHNTLLEYE
jgi:hypothetical protein